MRLLPISSVNIDERSNGFGYVTVGILDLARIARMAYHSYDDNRAEMAKRSNGSEEAEFFVRQFADMAEQALRIVQVLESTLTVESINEDCHRNYNGFADALEFKVCTKCALVQDHDCQF